MTETVKLKDRHPWRQPVCIMTALNIVRGYVGLWGINLSGTWETAGVLVLVLLSVVFDVKVLIPQAEAKTTPLVDPRDTNGRRLTPENGLDQLNTAMQDVSERFKGLSTALQGAGTSAEDVHTQRLREHLEHTLNDPEVRDEMEDPPDWLLDRLDAQEGSEVPDELEAPEDGVDGR